MELPGALVLLWCWVASGAFTPGLGPPLPPLGNVPSRLWCLRILRSSVPCSSTSMATAYNAKGRLRPNPTPSHMGESAQTYFPRKEIARQKEAPLRDEA